MEGQGQGGTGNISLLEALGFVARRRRVGSEGVVAAEEEYVGKDDFWHDAKENVWHVGKQDYWHDANVELRFLVVPPEAHESVYNPLRLGLLQYVSKNVGMRRARGRWTLVTNADCLVTLDLLRFIAHTVHAAEGVAEGSGAAGDAGGAKQRKGFYLAHRSDLPIVLDGGYPFDVAIVGEDGKVHHPLSETVSTDLCMAEPISGNVYRGTSKLMGLLNIGDFFLAESALVAGAYGYSEHFLPFGLDGEFVCRLGLMHDAQAFFIHKPCVILHQYHPHAYNFSHPPFPWQTTCEAYESGQMWAPGTIVKDLESHVSAAWGMPHLVLEEVLVTSEGSVLRTRRTAPAQH